MVRFQQLDPTGLSTGPCTVRNLHKRFTSLCFIRYYYVCGWQQDVQRNTVTYRHSDGTGRYILSQDWSDDWLLLFHPDKCVVIQVCLPWKHNEKPVYFMRWSDGTLVKLEVSSCEKDIGVYVDEDLTFETHIETEVNTANSIMGIIRRSFTCIDEEMFTLLFKALVRPHLYYAQAIWSPYLKKHINLIEQDEMVWTGRAQHRLNCRSMQAECGCTEKIWQAKEIMGWSAWKWQKEARYGFCWPSKSFWVERTPSKKTCQKPQPSVEENRALKWIWWWWWECPT